MNSLKDHLSNTDDAYDTGIGTQFSAETNKRDEDDEMYVSILPAHPYLSFLITMILRLKYIEEQLTKRKKKFDEDDTNSSNIKNSEYMNPEEAALQALPEHLRISSVHHSEEMLSNQMLSGIPEIDLGIE